MATLTFVQSCQFCNNIINTERTKPGAALLHLGSGGHRGLRGGGQPAGDGGPEAGGHGGGGRGVRPRAGITFSPRHYNMTLSFT